MVFIDVGEDSIMANDVVGPSNPLIVPIEKEELKKTLFDMNVSQRLHEEKSSKKVMCIRIDSLAWDHQLSLNRHALTIYL